MSTETNLRQFSATNPVAQKAKQRLAMKRVIVREHRERTGEVLTIEQRNQILEALHPELKY